MHNRIYFRIKKQHKVSLERPRTSGQNPQTLLSYCRKLNTGMVQPFFSIINIINIYKNLEKYKIHWLQNLAAKT
jgi:hypothetical protein